MTTRISATSTEYVRATVVAFKDGVAIDPTADTVAMAFLSNFEVGPVTGDLHAAQWETITTGQGPIYKARCLLGPGGVALTVGTYAWWIRVTDAPEVPTKRIGEIDVGP